MKYFIILLNLLLSFSAQAKDVEIEAIGVGDSYDWAIMNAIDNAVKQSQGVTISRQAPIQKLEMNSSFNEKSNQSASFNIEANESLSIDNGEFLSGAKRASYDGKAKGNANAEQSYNSKNTATVELKKIDAKYKGSIKKYRVLSSEEKNDKFYVKILATVFEPEEYKSPKLGGKKSDYSLSILPFKTSSNFYCLGSKISSKKLGERLANGLNSKLSSTKKFNILDRQNFDIYADELGLINNEFTKEEDKSKLKNITSADYMLVGTLDKYLATSDTEHIAITGEDNITSSASLQVSYKILETATMEVILASTAKYNFYKEGNFSSCVNVNELLSRKVSDKITLQIMDELFPNYQAPTKKQDKNYNKTQPEIPAKRPIITLPFD